MHSEYQKSKYLLFLSLSPNTNLKHHPSPLWNNSFIKFYLLRGSYFALSNMNLLKMLNNFTKNKIRIQKHNLFFFFLV